MAFGKDTIEVEWEVGGWLKCKNKKKLVKFAKIIPEIEVSIIFDGDIDGMNLEAYYKKPGFKDGDDAYLDTSLIADKKATFKLEGNVLEEFGIWEVDFVIRGSDGSDIGSTNPLRYTVVKNVEGLGGALKPSLSLANSIGELIEEMNDGINEVENKVDTEILRVVAKTDSEIIRLEDKGDVEVERVKIQGDVSETAVKTVQTEIEDLIKNTPASGVALSVGNLTEPVLNSRYLISIATKKQDFEKSSNLNKKINAGSGFDGTLEIV